MKKIVLFLLFLFMSLCLASTDKYIKINGKNYSKIGYVSLDLIPQNNKIDFINLGFQKPLLVSKCSTSIKIDKLTKNTISFSFSRGKNEKCLFYLKEKTQKIEINLNITHVVGLFKNCQLTPQFEVGSVSTNHIKKYYPEINFLSQDSLSVRSIINYYDFTEKVTNLTYYFDNYLSPLFIYGQFANYEYPIGFNAKYISRKLPSTGEKSTTLGVIHPSGFFARRDLSTGGEFYFVPNAFSKGIFFTNSKNERCVEFQRFSSGR